MSVGTQCIKMYFVAITAWERDVWPDIGTKVLYSIEIYLKWFIINYDVNYNPRATNKKITKKYLIKEKKMVQ